MAPWRSKVLASLPLPLRRLLAPDLKRELLGGVDVTLMVFGDRLLRLDSGEAVNLEADSAADVATAATRLTRSQPRRPRVCLLLPPDEFVATPCHLPGLSEENLESALALQQDVLLPACEQELAMAVNPESVALGEDHVALWIPQKRLESLYKAFTEQEIDLAALRPRLLCVNSQAAEVRVTDRDERSLTSVALNQGAIMQWLQVAVSDLEKADFSEQWQQELKGHPTAKAIEADAAEAYHRQTDLDLSDSYWFFPAPALALVSQKARARQILAAAVCLVVLGIVAALPFLWQEIEMRRAEAELAASLDASSEARRDQAVVASFENEWGPVDNYPQMNLRSALFALQGVLSPDRLTTLEISEGRISIEGSSNDPQAILQRLEQDPLFTEAVFARATSNTRYFIDLRLSPVNFEGYFLRYFPDD